MVSSHSTLPASDDLLHDVLEVSLTGIILFRPVYDAAAASIQDFTYDYLSPAAQRMLHLPERPAESFLTRYPNARAEGIFAFYARAFASGQTERYQVNYQHDELDGYFHLVARRSGEQLVVSFTDTNDQPRSEVEEALRQSQARERTRTQELAAAAQQLVQEREDFYQILEQAPVAISILRGEELRYSYMNPVYQRLVPGVQLLGRTVTEVRPDAESQASVALIQQVYQAGESRVFYEQPYELDPLAGSPQQHYFTFNYSPLRENGQVVGVSLFVYDVTDVVLARQQREGQQQQVQTLNEELAAINEELRASNEEYQLANTALSEAQQQLRELNEELEARVQQRTQELEASHQAAEALQAELLAAAQRQVQEHEDLYQVFAQTPAAVLLLRGPAHRIDYVNAAGEELFPGRQLLGRPIAESQPESAAQGFVALLDRVYQTGETHLGIEVPLTVQPAPGQPARTTYFNFSYQAYREQGQIVGVSSFAYDVTEQVLARQQREAQQSELQRVFEQAPVAIGLFAGEELRITALNPPMAVIFGLPADQLLGRLLLEGLPELQGQGFDDLMRQVQTTQVPFVGQEMPVTLTRNGEPLVMYYNLVFQPLYGAAGQVEGIFEVAVEVTEQVLARQQVQRLNEELAAINEELTVTNEELHESNSQLVRTNADLDNFVYTASHDLKSPISNIEGLLALLPELLPNAVLADQQVAPVLDRMHESIERFQRTIAHLTDVSRLQAEFAQPAETVSLAAVIEDVRQDLYFQFLEAGAVLDVAVNNTQPRVFSPKNLRSLIYNLLSNALKYRQPERTPLVHISCQPAGNALVLTVQDNGLGLSTTQQQRLFQLFQRLHTHVEGSGVGLYAVKKILENAGGRIEVESELGVGTTFRLTFPA